MTKTTNYNLNQWEAEDVIKREDFNADNATIDAALAAVADAAGSGAKIAYGTYTGTGSYGSNNRNSLTFDFEPRLVFVTDHDLISFYFPSTSEFCAVFLRPLTKLQYRIDSGTIFVTNAAWSGNTVSWNTTSAQAQLNQSGRRYAYFAIG